MTRQEFAQKVNSLIPNGNKILSSLTIAQAIIESSDSKGNVANSTLTKLGNALFGIKATSSWHGKSLNCATREVYKTGEWHGQAAFRAYDSWQESIIDHENFLVNECSNRYKNVIGERDYKIAAQAIQTAGYATDPGYARTIISIIEHEKLYLYDTIANAKTYTVKPGDSFWKIAAIQLGNGNRYIELAKFNGMTTRTVIHPGQVIKLPI